MRFNLNESGVEHVVKSARAAAALAELADRTKGEVESQAQRFRRTGRFARSIETTGVERTLRGLRTSVHSTDPDAHIVEWGSKNNPPYAPLRKAASSLGLRLRGDD